MSAVVQLMELFFVLVKKNVRDYKPQTYELINYHYKCNIIFTHYYQLGICNRCKRRVQTEPEICPISVARN